MNLFVYMCININSYVHVVTKSILEIYIKVAKAKKIDIYMYIDVHNPLGMCAYI